MNGGKSTRKTHTTYYTTSAEQKHLYARSPKYFKKRPPFHPCQPIVTRRVLLPLPLRRCSTPRPLLYVPFRVYNQVFFTPKTPSAAAEPPNCIFRYLLQFYPRTLPKNTCEKFYEVPTCSIVLLLRCAGGGGSNRPKTPFPLNPPPPIKQIKYDTCPSWHIDRSLLEHNPRGHTQYIVPENRAPSEKKSPEIIGSGRRLAGSRDSKKKKGTKRRKNPGKKHKTNNCRSNEVDD